MHIYNRIISPHGKYHITLLACRLERFIHRVRKEVPHYFSVWHLQ